MAEATWLHAPDVAGNYLRGLQLGSSIAEEQQRLAMQDRNAQMQMQARQEEMARETQLNQQKLATEKAYHDTLTGLRKQQLEQAGQQVAAKTQQAARMYAAQQNYANMLKSGVAPDQALYANPDLATPSAVGRTLTATKKNEGKQYGEPVTQKIGGRTVVYRPGSPGMHVLKEGEKAQRMPTMDIPLPVQPGQWASPTMKGIPMDSPLINQTLGTNAPPGTGTNFAPRAIEAMPVPSKTNEPAMGIPVAQAKTPFKEGAVIRNKKNNKLYRVVDGEPVEVDEEEN